MLRKYLEDVASVSTYNYDLDMATYFIYSFPLLSKEDVKGTVWEDIHNELPMPPLQLAMRIHEVLRQGPTKPTFSQLYSPKD